jgi:hypothetical protein
MYNIQRSPIIALNEKQSKWELFLHQITDEKTTEHIDPTNKNRNSIKLCAHRTSSSRSGGNVFSSLIHPRKLPLSFLAKEIQ